MKLSAAQKRFLLRCVISNELELEHSTPSCFLKYLVASGLVKKGLMQWVDTLTVSFTEEGKSIAKQLLNERQKAIR